MIVELDELTFHATTGGGFDGLLLQRLTNWDDLAASKSKIEERPQDHGAFEQEDEILRAAMTFELGAAVLCSSEESAVAWRNTLRGIAARPGKRRLQVSQGADVSTRMVRVARASIPSNPRDAFQFAFDLVAVDPRRYGLEQSGSTVLPVTGGGLTFPLTFPLSFGEAGELGEVTFHNTGTAASWPLFRVRGGFSEGFLLAEVGTGREIRFVGVVPDTSWIIINPRTGTAWIDDLSDRSGDLERSDWWSVPAGGESTVRFSSLGGVTGSPLLETTFAPASW